MDKEYQEYLKREVEDLRALGHKFLNGEASRADFKGMSGGMGSYAQKDGQHFMIRLRTPSGVITRAHFRLILDYAKQCGLERIHCTTRQAIQLHDLTIDQVCDIMSDAMDHDLYTRGGGGNFPRNVALSPLAGVDVQEIFDVTPYAMAIGSYFLDHATSYKLPRKLKVAFSSGPDDTAFATINDMGFIAVEQDGKPYFKLWLAGGMGGGPALGLPFDELVDPREVLYYVEAMVRLFAAEGDYEHRARARIRFIPRRMGVEAFMECYKGYVKQVKEECHFEPIEPVLSEKDEWEPESFDLGADDAQIVIPQRQKDLYTAVLHAVGGQIPVEDWEALDAFLDTCKDPSLRLGMLEDVFVRGLTADEVRRLLALTEGRMVRTNIEMSVSCIGVPTCQAGIQASQNLCHAIIKAVNESGMAKRYLPRIMINGCPSSCSRHPVAELGFAGKVKPHAGERVDAFECFVGGKVSQEESRMAVSVGTIPAAVIPEFIVELGRELESRGVSYQAYVAEHMEEVKTLAERYAI
ncbi:MAG: nitrite/sulfite reductase [Clostridiales bacterium]|nr:nitrite/sulfite reductase [Clostridiales bacterium]